MSTPRSLDLPAGVRRIDLMGMAGDIAALDIDAQGERRGHVLLIPGWTGSKEDFTPLLPLLAEAGYDATAYDQRGQYESAPGDDYALDEFARDAYYLIQQAESFSHVLGHSFGGLVAQRVACRHTENVASLSLLCTGPGALGDSPARPLSMLVQALDAMTLEQVHASLQPDPTAGPEQTPGSPDPDPRPGPEIEAFLRTRFTSNDRDSLRAMTQHLIDAPDVIDQVAATALPCWVGRGVDDDAWPHDAQDRMAARLGTEVHVVEDAAHSPAVENPSGLAEAWVPFLRRHDKTSR